MDIRNVSSSPLPRRRGANNAVGFAFLPSLVHCDGDSAFFNCCSLYRRSECKDGRNDALRIAHVRTTNAVIQYARAPEEEEAAEKSIKSVGQQE